MIAEGTPAALTSRSAAATKVVLRASRAFDTGIVSGATGVEAPVVEGDVLRFTTTSVNRAIADVTNRLEAAGIETVELQVRKATLEDVIVELTGAGLRE